MHYQHQFPMVRLLVPFMAGIICALEADRQHPVLTYGMFMLLAIPVVWVLASGRTAAYRTRWIFGVILSAGLGLFGFNLVNLKQEIRSVEHYCHFSGEILLTRIIDPPREKERSWKVLTEVLAVKQGNGFRPVKGKLLAYVAKDSSGTFPPSFGDYLLLHGVPETIPQPRNPGTFNYQRYLQHNQVYRQLYLKLGEWKQLPLPGQNTLKGLSLRIRDYLMEVLRQNHLSGREYEVAAALILGQDELLDYETRQEYSAAGVVHILGISGLHVGIVYLVLNAAFGFLDKRRRGKYLKLMLVLATIWFYALITGLSPAALRSSAMFSFVSLGNVAKRNVHIINSLATSAFFLLLFNPFLVTNIGFQFSYIAVIGIVLIQEPIAKYWEPDNRILNQVWQLTAMSLAAQLVTLPLTLCYFHQFPVYFLPANLLVIPLSNLVIYSGMSVLLVSFIPLLSGLAGQITSLLIRLLNWIVHFFDTLPHALITPIPFTSAQAILFYLCLSSLLLYLFQKRNIGLIRLLLCLLLFILSGTIQGIRHDCQKKLLIYSINRHSALGIITDRDCLLIADSALLQDEKLMNYNLSGSKAQYGVRRMTVCTAGDFRTGKSSMRSFTRPVPGGMVLLSGSKRIAMIHARPSGNPTAKPLEVDFLIINGNPRLKIDRLLLFYKTKLLVLDGSNSFYRCNLWKEECYRQGIRVWDVRSQGALVADLD